MGVVVLRGNCPTNRGSCPGGNWQRDSCPTGVIVPGVIDPRVAVLGVVVPGVVVLEP